MAALLRALSGQAKLDEALTWTPHARSVLARVGSSDPAAAELSRDPGWIHYHRRDADEALRIRRLGEEHPSVTIQEHNLGSLLTDLEQPGDARALIGRSHAKIKRDPTTSAISLASSLYTLARIEQLRGERRSAARHLQQALTIPVDEERADHREDAPLIKALLATIYHQKRKTRRRGQKLGREALTELRALAALGTPAAQLSTPAWH